MIDLSPQRQSELLAKIMAAEIFDSVDELIEACYFDSVAPAICAEPGCGHIDDLEPDQQDGWCEVCHKNSMVSALILAGMI